jgi:epoxide hydrolase 4
MKENVTPSIVPNDIDKHVTHHYANNNGVQIHYASIGKGPLIVMIHGFPDFWYTWRNQMVALAPLFQVVALDLQKAQQGLHLPLVTQLDLY